MPPRFKCAVGGEWKPSAEFSQNQLKLWTQRKRHDNDGITSINIGLVCKVHNSGPQLAQIKCQGPCGLRKSREAFSKRQRNQPDAVSTSQACPSIPDTPLTGDSGASNVRIGRSVTQDTSSRVLPRTALYRLMSSASLTNPRMLLEAPATPMVMSKMTVTTITATMKAAMTTTTAKLVVASWSRSDEAFFNVLLVATPRPTRTMTMIQRTRYVYPFRSENLCLTTR